MQAASPGCGAAGTSRFVAPLLRCKPQLSDHHDLLNALHRSDVSFETKLDNVQRFVRRVSCEAGDGYTAALPMHLQLHQRAAALDWCLHTLCRVAKPFSDLQAVGTLWDCVAHLVADKKVAHSVLLPSNILAAVTDSAALAEKQPAAAAFALRACASALEAITCTGATIQHTREPTVKLCVSLLERFCARVSLVRAADSDNAASSGDRRAACVDSGPIELDEQHAVLQALASITRTALVFLQRVADNESSHRKLWDVAVAKLLPAGMPLLRPGEIGDGAAAVGEAPAAVVAAVSADLKHVLQQILFRPEHLHSIALAFSMPKDVTAIEKLAASSADADPSGEAASVKLYTTRLLDLWPNSIVTGQHGIRAAGVDGAAWLLQCFVAAVRNLQRAQSAAPGSRHASSDVVVAHGKAAAGSSEPAQRAGVIPDGAEFGFVWALLRRAMHAMQTCSRDEQSPVKDVACGRKKKRRGQAVADLAGPFSVSATGGEDTAAGAWVSAVEMAVAVLRMSVKDSVYKPTEDRDGRQRGILQILAKVLRRTVPGQRAGAPALGLRSADAGLCSRVVAASAQLLAALCALEHRAIADDMDFVYGVLVASSREGGGRVCLVHGESLLVELISGFSMLRQLDTMLHAFLTHFIDTWNDAYVALLRCPRVLSALRHRVALVPSAQAVPLLSVALSAVRQLQDRIATKATERLGSTSKSQRTVTFELSGGLSALLSEMLSALRVEVMQAAALAPVVRELLEALASLFCDGTGAVAAASRSRTSRYGCALRFETLLPLITLRAQALRLHAACGAADPVLDKPLLDEQHDWVLGFGSRTFVPSAAERALQDAADLLATRAWQPLSAQAPTATRDTASTSPDASSDTSASRGACGQVTNGSAPSPALDADLHPKACTGAHAGHIVAAILSTPWPQSSVPLDRGLAVISVCALADTSEHRAGVLNACAVCALEVMALLQEAVLRAQYTCPRVLSHGAHKRNASTPAGDLSSVDATELDARVAELQARVRVVGSVLALLACDACEAHTAAGTAPDVHARLCLTEHITKRVLSAAPQWMPYVPSESAAACLAGLASLAAGTQGDMCHVAMQLLTAPDVWSQCRCAPAHWPGALLSALDSALLALCAPVISNHASTSDPTSDPAVNACLRAARYALALLSAGDDGGIEQTTASVPGQLSQLVSSSCAAILSICAGDSQHTSGTLPSPAVDTWLSRVDALLVLIDLATRRHLAQPGYCEEGLVAAVCALCVLACVASPAGRFFGHSVVRRAAKVVSQGFGKVGTALASCDAFALSPFATSDALLQALLTVLYRLDSWLDLTDALLTGSPPDNQSGPRIINERTHTDSGQVQRERILLAASRGLLRNATVKDASTAWIASLLEAAPALTQSCMAEAEEVSHQAHLRITSAAACDDEAERPAPSKRGRESGSETHNGDAASPAKRRKRLQVATSSDMGCPITEGPRQRALLVHALAAALSSSVRSSAAQPGRESRSAIIVQAPPPGDELVDAAKSPPRDAVKPALAALCEPLQDACMSLATCCRGARLHGHSDEAAASHSPAAHAMGRMLTGVTHLHAALASARRAHLAVSLNGSGGAGFVARSAEAGLCAWLRDVEVHAEMLNLLLGLCGVADEPPAMAEGRACALSLPVLSHAILLIMAALETAFVTADEHFARYPSKKGTSVGESSRQRCPAGDTEAATRRRGLDVIQDACFRALGAAAAAAVTDGSDVSLLPATALWDAATSLLQRNAQGGRRSAILLSRRVSSCLSSTGVSCSVPDQFAGLTGALVLYEAKRGRAAKAQVQALARGLPSVLLAQVHAAWQHGQDPVLSAIIRDSDADFWGDRKYSNFAAACSRATLALRCMESVVQQDSSARASCSVALQAPLAALQGLTRGVHALLPDARADFVRRGGVVASVAPLMRSCAVATGVLRRHEREMRALWPLLVPLAAAALDALLTVHQLREAAPEADGGRDALGHGVEALVQLYESLAYCPSAGRAVPLILFDYLTSTSVPKFDAETSEFVPVLPVACLATLQPAVLQLIGTLSAAQLQHLHVTMLAPKHSLVRKALSELKQAFESKSRFKGKV